ncbi:jg256 [Pararge aegeria aegeria]|uniref:Jg256 protein n=1 Tax=Pararge aegeria aegeria TaxID=348720 RepID=A0A8S4QXQ3_9NEOP|nr:jg256 [Pararge aegeria aegeria]
MGFLPTKTSSVAGLSSRMESPGSPGRTHPCLCDALWARPGKKRFPKLIWLAVSHSNLCLIKLPSSRGHIGVNGKIPNSDRF